MVLLPLLLLEGSVRWVITRKRKKEERRKKKEKKLGFWGNIQQSEARFSHESHLPISSKTFKNLRLICECLDRDVYRDLCVLAAFLCWFLDFCPQQCDLLKFRSEGGQDLCSIHSFKKMRFSVRTRVFLQIQSRRQRCGRTFDGLEKGWT